MIEIDFLNKRPHVHKKILRLWILFLFLSSKSVFSEINAAKDPRLYLNFPFAGAQALSNGGIAAPGDSSSPSVNPALLSVSQQNYEIFTQYGFSGDINSLNLGIKDNVSTEVSAEFRVHQLLGENQEDRQRRMSLALSYLLHKIPLSIGMTINFDQYNLDKWNSSGTSSRFSANLGSVYECKVGDQPLFLGFAVNRLNDSTLPTTFDFGLSAPIYNGIYYTSLDSILDVDGKWKEQFGVQLQANKYFEMKGSFGYNISSQQIYYGAGLFFNAPVLHVYYGIARLDLNDKTLWQTAGLSINLSM